jgi:hypothetical protein
MNTDRREFLERLAVGTAFLAGAPFSGAKLPWATATPVAEAPDPWDVSWVDKITGKYRGVFDCPNIEGGEGVFRARTWIRQYGLVMKTDPKDMSAVIVLRANGIALAMSQEFWDKYDIAKLSKVADPDTNEPITKNPILLAASRGEVPKDFEDFMLPQQIAAGTIVLACNLALGNMVSLVVNKTKQSRPDARKETLAALVPGVILQPSGVFAVMRAQDAGCKYLRAS